MCLIPDLPDVPSPAERQSAKQPAGDIRARLTDRDRRRRGYAATMFGPSVSSPAGTTNITGV